MSDATLEIWNGLDKNEKNTIYSKKKIQACRGIGSAFVCPPPERRSMAFKRSGVRLLYAPPQFVRKRQFSDFFLVCFDQNLVQKPKNKGLSASVFQLSSVKVRDKRADAQYVDGAA